MGERSSNARGVWWVLLEAWNWRQANKENHIKRK